MLRKPRFIIPGMSIHFVQHRHSCESEFFEDVDYLEWIGEVTKNTVVKYMLMY